MAPTLHNHAFLHGPVRPQPALLDTPLEAERHKRDRAEPC